MEVFRKYLDAEQPESLGISINTLGHHIHPKNSHYPDRSHPENYYFEWEKGRSLSEFQILYISKGEGFFETTGLPPILIEEGTIFLLYPGVWHRYKPNIETGWEEYWVGFSGIYAEYLLEQECFSPQSPIIKVGFNAEFLNAFSKLIEVVEEKEKSFKNLSSFLLIQMLGIVYASALLSKEKLTAKEKMIYKIKDEIYENWNQKIDFEELSASHNVSYVWFRKAFKETLGIAPNQFHLMLKLQKAEQMIHETNLTLSEIAYKTGFESEFYFSRIFKQKFNYNPSEIRKGK